MNLLRPWKSHVSKRWKLRGVSSPWSVLPRRASPSPGCWPVKGPYSPPPILLRQGSGLPGGAPTPTRSPRDVGGQRQGLGVHGSSGPELLRTAGEASALDRVSEAQGPAWNIQVLSWKLWQMLQNEGAAIAGPARAGAGGRGGGRQQGCVFCYFPSAGEELTPDLLSRVSVVGTAWTLEPFPHHET